MFSLFSNVCLTRYCTRERDRESATPDNERENESRERSVWGGKSIAYQTFRTFPFFFECIRQKRTCDCNIIHCSLTFRISDTRTRTVLFSLSLSYHHTVFLCEFEMYLLLFDFSSRVGSCETDKTGKEKTFNCCTRPTFHIRSNRSIPIRESFSLFPCIWFASTWKRQSPIRSCRMSGKCIKASLSCPDPSIADQAIWSERRTGGESKITLFDLARFPLPSSS